MASQVPLENRVEQGLTQLVRRVVPVALGIDHAHVRRPKRLVAPPPLLQSGRAHLQVLAALRLLGRDIEEEVTMVFGELGL